MKRCKLHMARGVREAGPSRGAGRQSWWSTRDEKGRQSENWWNLKLVNCSSYAEAVGQGGGEVQTADLKRRQRIQELETLVAMLGESENLEDYKQKATEELETLKVKGVDKRPHAQKVASTEVWIKKKKRSGSAMERQKAHFYEEKVLETAFNLGKQSRSARRYEIRHESGTSIQENWCKPLLKRRLVLISVKKKSFLEQ